MFFFHTSACYGFTFSGAPAPRPPRQVESRKMQRLLPETAMKELHSQAPGGHEVETIRRHEPKAKRFMQESFHMSSMLVLMP